MAFAGGAALVIPPPGPLAGEALASVLRDCHVTHALITPSVLATVGTADFPDFRVLIVGA
jgi:hypothetical protein